MHGFTSTPLYLAAQAIDRLVPLSPMPVICQSNFAPSVTEVSSPLKMMPPRSVTRPLWNAVTVAGATPVGVELWQVVQSVAAVMVSWNVNRTS